MVNSVPSPSSLRVRKSKYPSRGVADDFGDEKGRRFALDDAEMYPAMPETDFVPTRQAIDVGTALGSARARSSRRIRIEIVDDVPNRFRRSVETNSAGAT